MSVIISDLFIKNFRNFDQKKLSFSSELVLLVGNNGVGKTNTLEAISILGRGASLRGDDLEEMLNINSPSSLLLPPSLRKTRSIRGPLLFSDNINNNSSNKHYKLHKNNN